MNDDEMKNNRTDIDRLFEQGVADVSREPRKTLSDEQIKVAAAASSSGVGVWLLAHAREILIGMVSFFAGCLVTVSVLHYVAPKPSEPQAGANVNTIALPAESESMVVETFHETSLQNEDHTVPSSVNPTSNVARHKSHLQTPESQVQSPKSQEPVVVKKTVVQRDTVVINETVTLKDTVYLKEN